MWAFSFSGNNVCTPIQVVGRKRSNLTLKEWFKKTTSTFFLTSFFICLIIHSRHVWNLMWGQVRVHVVYSPNDLFFPIGFKHFFHYIGHLVGPPPSHNPWFITLHLWQTFGPYEDPPFSLCPWWGDDSFPWCYVGCKDARF